MYLVQSNQRLRFFHNQHLAALVTTEIYILIAS